MQRYQIRTPQGWTVEDIVEELSGKGWDAVRRYLDFSDSRAPLKDYRRFQNALYHLFLPRLRAFRLCGVDEVCSDHVVAAPLCKEPHRFDISPLDFIYHFYIPGDLEQFVKELATNAAEAIESLIKSGRHEAITLTLQALFKEILADYVYSNPACGVASICSRSTVTNLPLAFAR
jgi:hypothetical protein